MSHHFELRHTVHGDPSEIFAAWLEPERLKAWFRPSESFRTESADVDARVGGEFRISLAAQDGSTMRVRGRYLAIELGRRLEFSHLIEWEGAAGELPDELPRVVVEFREVEGGSELWLREEGIPDRDLVPQLESAWYGCLARLAGALESSLGVFFERVTRFPRMRSEFGGLWPDYSDAEERIQGKLELGVLTEAEAQQFRHWNEKGFLVLEGACPPDKIDRFLADVERTWEEEREGVRIEYFENGQRYYAPIARRYRTTPHKVLDLHGHSPSARELVFAPAIQRFLAQLFERPPMAFQSLLFGYGTEQEMHQDTAYVLLSSPMEFVGCWIALEDVQPGSGELRYFEGSHRIEEYRWLGRARAKPYDYLDDREFLDWVRERSLERDLPLTPFLPKKGDAVIWHADLVHGGAPRVDRDATRNSLVTHLCPKNVLPEWFGTTRHSEIEHDVAGGYYCYRYGD